MAFDLYIAVHHIHDVLGDRHAKPGALDATDSCAVFSGKSLEYMLEILLGHSDAVVFYRELVRRMALYAARLLDKPDDDVSAGLRELDCVSNDIEQNLVQPELVCDHVLVHHVLRIDKEVLVFCLDEALYHRAKVVQQVWDVDVCLLELYRAALYTAHIEDVVYQAQKVRAGGRDLAEIILHLRLIVAMCLRQRRKPDDGVHRRADVMGHAV